MIKIKTYELIENYFYLYNLIKIFGLKRVGKLGLMSTLAVIIELFSLIMLINLFGTSKANNFIEKSIISTENPYYFLILLSIFIVGTLSRVYVISKNYRYSFQVLQELTEKLLKLIEFRTDQRKLNKDGLKFILANKLSDFAVKNLSHFSMLITQFFLVIGYFIIGIYLIGLFYLYVTIIFLLAYIIIIILFNQNYDSDIFKLEKNVNDRFNNVVDYSKWLILNNKLHKISLSIKNILNKISIMYMKKNIILILPKALLDLLIIFSIAFFTYYDLFQKFEIFSISKLIIIASISLKLLPSLQSLFRSLDALMSSKELFYNITKEIYNSDNCQRKVPSEIEIIKNAKFNIHIPSQIIDIYGNKISTQSTRIVDEQLIKIVGPSGSGKSLLMEDLCLRKNNFNIRFSQKYINSWKSNNAIIIDQDTNLLKLYSESFLYFPDHDVEYFKKLLLIFNYPNDCIINNSHFSGGQLQIINILLVLSFKHKNIIIFDEVFSSIDPVIESQILNYIKANFIDTQFFIISHRSDNDKYYDLIIKL